MNDRNSRREARERGEHEAERAEESLTPQEREQVHRNRRLSAVTVYTIVRREGEEELRRPVESLWWSGIAAGIGISTSVLASGVLHQFFLDHPNRLAIESLGYTVGFILVIVSRLQLFTENTISVILPLLSEPNRWNLWRSARLWAVVFAANLVGTFFTAFITVYFQTTEPVYVGAMLEVSRRFAEHDAWHALVYGIPAGFYIAAIVWMLPSVKGSEVVVIALFTYLIAVGGFTHVVVGAAEVFLLLLVGELDPGHAFLGLILPVFVGNVIGGTGLFALLAYAQVHEEV